MTQTVDLERDTSPVEPDTQARVDFLFGRAPARVLLVSSSGALTADVSTTLFAAGARVRTSNSVADARRFLESAPEWPNVIAVAAKLRDGTARDVVDSARDQRVDAVVLSEEENDVEVWLGRLSDVGVSISTTSPASDSPLAVLTAALRARRRDACRAALPDDVALFVRRLVPTAELGAQARAIARGRVVVGDALFTLAADATRISLITSSRGTSLACTFADRRALVRIVEGHPTGLALELSWHTR